MGVGGRGAARSKQTSALSGDVALKDAIPGEHLPMDGDCIEPPYINMRRCSGASVLL